MSLKNLFSNKTFVVAVSLLLVLALGATLFGIEYASAVDDKNSLSSELEQFKKQNAALQSENAANKAKAEQNAKDKEQLQSKINALEKENSQLKLTKANKKPNSGKVSTTTTNNKVVAPKINMSLLTAPNTGSKVCYLTFDDGPSDNTLKILAILKKANAKASFFVISTSKLSYIKRAYNEGHTIGLHANNHDYAKIYKSDTAYFDDLSKIQSKVKNLIGVDTKIIRFPGGSSNLVSKKYSKGIMTRLAKKVTAKGYVYVDWNVDSTDASAAKRPKAAIVKSVQTYAKNKGDICLLMHDTSAKTTTVDALPEIICYLRGLGYRFEALKVDSPIFHHGINN